MNYVTLTVTLYIDSFVILVDYSDENVKERYRKDLAGQLGNLVSRSISSSLNPSLTISSQVNKVNERDVSLHNKLQGLSGIITLFPYYRKALSLVFYIRGTHTKREFIIVNFF